jgi:hypothetical protein
MWWFLNDLAKKVAGLKGGSQGRKSLRLASGTKLE